jgi:hypothetical protein
LRCEFSHAVSGIVGAALARHFDPDAGAANPAPAATRTFERVLLKMRVVAAVHRMA